MLYDPKRWKEPEVKAQAPQFGAQPWHSRGYLDARPMIWSLRNRPQEWERPWDGSFFIQHKPSEHKFYRSGWGIYEARCSCDSRAAKLGAFSWVQMWQVRRAIRAWEGKWQAEQDSRELAKINQHFATHFIPQAVSNAA